MSTYYHRRSLSRSSSRVYNRPLRYMSQPSQAQKNGRTYRISAAFVRKAPDEMPHTDETTLEQSAQNLIQSNYIIPPEKPFYYAFHSKMIRIPIFQDNNQRGYLTQYDANNWGINSSTLDDFCQDPLFLRAIGALNSDNEKQYPDDYHVTISVFSIDFTTSQGSCDLKYCSVQNENALIPQTIFNGIALSGTQLFLSPTDSGVIGPITIDSPNECSYKFLVKNQGPGIIYQNTTSSWNNDVFKFFNDHNIDFMLATNTMAIAWNSETVHPAFSTNATNNNLFMPNIINDNSLFWTIWVNLEHD